MTGFEFPHIGTTKQVFIDYSLVEPGYGVTWGDGIQASWEMPHGIAIKAHKPRIDYEPMVGPRKAVGDGVHAPHHPLRGRRHLQAVLHGVRRPARGVV